MDGRRSCHAGQRNRLLLCPPARRRPPVPTPDNRRDTHKLMVVARTRPHDGSARALGDVFGTGVGLAWPATAGLTAPRVDMSGRTSGLLARVPGSVVHAVGAAAPAASPA